MKPATKAPLAAPPLTETDGNWVVHRDGVSLQDARGVLEREAQRLG